MRSALFIHNDENLMNRIKITVHDDNAHYFFSDSIDKAIGILDNNEIAVAFIPYGYDVLNGNELIEIFIDHNPRIQIIVLFEEKDLLDVVHSHNNYHFCQVICAELFKIEDLQALLEIGFKAYNKEDDLKTFEKDYREKEDKYKKTLCSISTLLNDKIQCFSLIKEALNSTISVVCKNDNEITSKKITDYFNDILNEYMNLFMISSTNLIDYLKDIDEKYNNAKLNRYLLIKGEEFSLLPVEEHDNTIGICFAIYVVCEFINSFFEKNKGKIEVLDNDSFYILNIIFEAYSVIDSGVPLNKMLALIEGIIEVCSSKTVYAQKENVIQFKLMYKKNQL